MSARGIRTIPKNPEIIQNQYLVVFKQGVSSDQRRAHRAWAAEKHFSALSVRGHSANTVGLRNKFNIYNGRVAGYCASFDEETKKEVEETEEVDFVEPDMKVYALELTAQQNSPSWGLARLCNTETLTDSTKTTYVYDDAAAGEGTTAYIIDTGILADHVEFEDRATFGHNTVPGSSNTDRNGHGTHVAGTIGSKTYGVSKKAHLVGVKVLGDDGSGSNSTVINGIQWALEDAKKRGVKKCVANMSLGGGYSRALNMAVKAAIDQGLTMVVAAGNSGEDARFESPSSEPTAITVGATSVDDSVPYWSNWGALVDIFAPGDLITSCWIDESGGTALDKIETISGTSMASPHVCGLVAYLLSKDSAGELSTPAKIVKKIKALANNDKITAGLKKGSVNSLAYSGESAEKYLAGEGEEEAKQSD